MRSLTKERFSDARRFLLRRARPLEAALFRHAFEGGSADDVLSALQRFQNADGGFGQAIEPDFRLPDSSALGTSVGMQSISRVRGAAVPDAARRALEYLGSTYDPAREGWQPVPPAVAEHPRAFWWEPEKPEDAAGNWVNPGAELVGYLHEFPGVLPQDLREGLTRKAFAWLGARDEPLEMHDLLCYLRLAERLPEALKDRLLQDLARHVQAVVATDAAKWSSYGLQPIQVAPSPSSRFRPLLASSIEANLDFLVDRQGADGAWEPTWAWGRYEEEWETAKEEWKGILTLEHLRVLRAYDRIA